MADIFISYARQDRATAERLAAALEREGWSVWWDRNLQSGAEFSAEIERELRAARAVLVCWSEHGVKSSWVRDEAVLAQRENKLRTISLDGAEPPIGFMQYHVHDMAGWDGKASHPAFAALAGEMRTSLVDSVTNGADANDSVSGAGFEAGPSAGGGRARLAVRALAVVVLVAAGAWWVFRLGDDGTDHAPGDMAATATAAEPGPSDNATKPADDEAVSVVVLPFENRSPSAADAYFADGVTEQILNALSGVEGLQVVARATAFSLRDQGRSIDEIADLLDVTHVLEGSVSRSGERVRITAQLVETGRGFNAWSNSYDREAGDLFAVQDDIARSIVAELPITGRGAGALTTVAGDAGVDAYDLYLLAREKWRSNRAEDSEELVGLLDRALALSPEFVEALALRAIFEILRSDVIFGERAFSMDEALPRAKRWIDEAERLEPDAPEVLHARGVYLNALGETGAAQLYYRDALAARPNDTDVRQSYAFTLMQNGKVREAARELETALDYDPAHAQSNTLLFHQYVLMQELDKAAAALDRWEAVDPDQRTVAFYRADWLRYSGRVAESLRAIEAIFDSGSSATGKCSGMFAEVLIRLAEYERVLDEFETCDNKVAWTTRSLTLQGRHDEAVDVALAWKEAEPDSPWPIDALLRSLFYAGRWSEYVDTLERNFQHVGPARDMKASPLTSVATGPYRRMAHPRAEEFDALGYGEKSEEGGIRYPETDVFLARVLVLDGREDEAMARLESALEKTFYTPWIPVDPVLGGLSGREDYEALVSDIERQVNAERAKLDLPPVTLARAVTGVQPSPAEK